MAFPTTRAARGAALALLLACPRLTPAAAGEDPAEAARPSLAQPSLSLSAEGARDRFRDGGGTAREGALALRGTLPLLERLRLDGGGFSAFGLSAQAEARAVRLDLDGAGDGGAMRFVRLGASLAGTWVPSAADLFWLSAGAFVAEQEALLGSAQVHPRVVALGAHRASDTLRLLYGAGYTYDFGRGLPLPFLGLVWRMAPDWRLHVLLPVVARATWTASDALSVDLGAAVAGEQFRYRAPSPAGPAERGPLELLHVARLRLGAGCAVAVARGVRLAAGAGVEGARIDTGLTTRSALGAYLTAAVLLGGRSGATPFLGAPP